MIWFIKKNQRGNTIAESLPEAGILVKSKEFESETGVFTVITDEDDLKNSGRLLNKVGYLSHTFFDKIFDLFKNQIETQAHTLKKIQAQLSQKIEQIVGNGLITGDYSYSNRKALIITQIVQHPDQVADALIYLDKRIFELEAHMSSFELIHMGEFIKPDRQFHNIRRLLLNIWHAFDDIFQKKNIRYKFNFQDTFSQENKVKLDYKTINTAFYNFFDNCSKYVLPDSEVIFNFDISDEKFEISIEMFSYLINQDEVEHIFELGYRCKSCKHLKGSGVGMFVFKKALEINKLTVAVNPTAQTLGKDGITYSKNVFLISGSFN